MPDEIHKSHLSLATGVLPTSYAT